MNKIIHLIPLFEDFGQSSFNSIWQGLGLLLLYLDANVRFLDISIKKAPKGTVLKFSITSSDIGFHDTSLLVELRLAQDGQDLRVHTWKFAETFQAVYST